MALASTDFMAAPGLYGSGNQPDRLDVSDVLAAILLTDTTTLGKIGMKGTASNIEHFWFEDALNDVYVSISLSADAENTSPIGYFSLLSSSTSVNQVLRSGALVRADGYNQVWKVITASVCTSLVAQSSTTVAVSAFPVLSSVALRCLVVAQPKPDTQTYSEDISRARTRRSNFTQVFERGIQIAETRKHVDLYAVKDELKLQIKNRTYEIKRELNNSIINGQAWWVAAATAPTPDTETRTMCGLLDMIQDPSHSGTRQTATVTSVSGALTMTSINGLVENIFNRGGFDDQSNCCIVVGPKQARVIALLEEQKVRKSNTELVVGSYANKVKTDLGYDLDVIIDRWFPPDMLMILDAARAGCMPLKGDSWHLERMAKTNRTDGYQLSGQYTCFLNNAAEAHGLLKELSYT